MKWYDVVTPIYDRAISRSYLSYRQVAVQALHLRPRFTVLDVGCGTGLNFELIMNAIGSYGTLIGIDSSNKMLNRACQKVNRQRWGNVHLLQLDARKLNRDELEAFIGRNITINSIICTLGFSVFSEWEAVFKRSFDLLENGGRYCIMDIFNDRVNFRTKIVSILANSDNSRQIWKPLKKRCTDYSEERYSMTHGDIVIVASGTKS
jgi:ubiquinone/menaquinone biosynthesis C-methylase UbiE